MERENEYDVVSWAIFPRLHILAWRHSAVSSITKCATTGDKSTNVTVKRRRMSATSKRDARPPIMANSILRRHQSKRGSVTHAHLEA